MEKESYIFLGGTVFFLYVLDMKEQSVKVKKLISALKNVAQNECAL